MPDEFATGAGIAPALFPFKLSTMKQETTMKSLNIETIKAIAAAAVELNSRPPCARIPDHHLIWILERIAGTGDGFVPAPIQKIIDDQPDPDQAAIDAGWMRGNYPPPIPGVRDAQGNYIA
tara:strand:+ start:788 stop:1150 length:363 start_codon:yes stop_codon:yes gene_type:complete